MSDEDYVEGDAGSAAADAPGAVPADDASPRDAKQGGIDSSAPHDAPVLQKQRSTARNAAARKAFAEAILANKKEAAAAPVTPSEADEVDPEAAIPAAAKGEIAAAKAAGSDATLAAAPAAIAAAATAAPPAPSLDPEVRQLLAHLKTERDQIAAERADWEKQRKAAEPPSPSGPESVSIEDYVDSAPRAYRNWLESMRGEKYATDDEFKREVQDFVTQLSSDVLGVPLPDSVRSAFDAAQAKKSVHTWKTVQAKKAAAAAAKAEQERTAATEKAEVDRVEHEWSKAASALGGQFAPQTDTEGKPQASAIAKSYPWLAAEDEPGKIIVDVIRAQLTKDGTQLQWQEASKRANDYLADQAKRYYDKRKPLLASVPAPVAAAPAAPKPVAAVVPPKPAPVADAAPKKWSNERHRETTKAAFRAAMAGEQK